MKAIRDFKSSLRVKILDNTTTFWLFKGKGNSCKAIKDSDPSAATGIYEIEIGGQIIELVCDMESSGGGWAVSLFMY